MQLGVHGALRQTEPHGYLRDPQVVPPAQQCYFSLPWRQIFDDLARRCQRDAVQRLGLGIGWGGLVSRVNVGLLAAECLPVPEVASLWASVLSSQAR